MTRRWLLILVFLFSGCLYAQDPFQVHGYIQGRFTDEPGTPDRLEIRRARLIISGDPISKFSYRFQVDFAKKPYLMDASVTWKFARPLAFTAGQMKIPFSAESILSDNLNPPIARSRAVLSLAPGRDTGVQGRDVGAEVFGGFHRNNGAIVEYSAGVFRGQTFIYSPQVHYNATAARVLAHPIHGLSVGADWYGSFDAPAGKVKRREDLEAQYDRGKLTLRAEQIFARDGTLERRGGYLLGAWRLSKNWETLSRADWLNTDINKANKASVAYIAGANRYLFNHAKVGFDAGAEHDEPSRWSSVMFAQVMLYF
jgi:hypothetical protein